MWLWSTIASSGTAERELGTTDRDEVQGPLEAAGFEPEVGRGDRGDEAVVEALGQPQRLVQGIPAEPDRELVQAQLARVKEPQQLDLAEMGLEQRAVLARVVLAQMPGVFGLLGAGGRQGEQVGRGDVGDGGDGGDPLQQAIWLVDVLDRLQKDDRVALAVELLDEAAL